MADVRAYQPLDYLDGEDQGGIREDAPKSKLDGSSHLSLPGQGPIESEKTFLPSFEASDLGFRA